jgi:hypothetical protein
MLKLLSAVLAAGVLGTVGWVGLGAKTAAESDCCYPGSPCCYAGSPCCGECCPDGACCAAGADCCAAKAEETAAACCAAGADCCDPPQACCAK